MTDVEAELSRRLAEEVDRGGVRRRLREHPFRTVRASAAVLRLALRLPSEPVRLPAVGEAPAVRRALRGYPLDRLLAPGLAAVLAVPAEADAYLLGRERMTVRRKMRAAERQGVTVRPVPPAERPRMLAMADEHERTNERAEYRIAAPDNADLLRYDLWLAAHDAAGEPIVLAVIPVAGTWSVLRHFRTLVGTPVASDARYLLSAAVVAALSARGVRRLVDPLPPTWLPNGLRHFQRMVGFRLVRLGRVTIDPETVRRAPVIEPQGR